MPGRHAAGGWAAREIRRDILDAANFLAGGRFDTGLSATWNQGDFGYDGTVDILDAADFLGAGLFDAGFYNPAPGSIAAVPEPSVTGIMGLEAGIAGLLAARRKRAA